MRYICWSMASRWAAKASLDATRIKTTTGGVRVENANSKAQDVLCMPTCSDRAESWRSAQHGSTNLAILS